MKLNKMLKLIGILGAFTLAVGCAGPAEKAPEAAPAPEKKMEPAMAEPMQTESAASASSSYEVSKGDHLWGISGSSYGNPYKWPLIYKANSDKIKDADLIYPGQVLDIDSDPSDADSAAAVNHAKSRGSWSIGVTEESDKAYLAQ